MQLKNLLILVLLLITVALFSQPSPSVQTWKESLSSKKATIQVYWNSFKPFAYKNQEGIPVGIEPDILLGFKDYVKVTYGVEITIEWIELPKFYDVYDMIKQGQSPASFGIAAISILESRKHEVQFSDPYLDDITIIVSNNVVPTSNSKADFIKRFDVMTGKTNINSTLESDLKMLKKQNGMSFNISYIAEGEEIVQAIDRDASYFGYVDLPNYLAALNDGLKVKRHNISPVIKDGLAIILPLKSDWNEPIQMYFGSVSFQYRKDQILEKHLGHDVLKLINQIGHQDEINSGNEIIILNKEKEIQERELNKAILKDQQQAFYRNLLIIGLLFIAIIASILFYTNTQKAKTNKVLVEQQQRIAEQQEAITKQNNSLTKSNKKLKRLNEQKNDLIGVLSHDLRTPINQIKGFAEIYKMENIGMEEGQSRLIDKIISTSDRLTTMIRKIMDVELVGANRAGLKMKRVNLSQLLKDIAISFEELAKSKKIKIVAEIDHDNLHIEADATYLIQVFENLISNAIKFSEEEKEVKLTIERNKDNIRALIKDQGPGLTNQDQKKLFRKYQKLSATPTAGEQSTGLGLSIVKKYVKLMNGKVWAESTPGEGSTFIVEFEKVT